MPHVHPNIHEASKNITRKKGHWILEELKILATHKLGAPADCNINQHLRQFFSSRSIASQSKANATRTLSTGTSSLATLS